MLTRRHFIGASTLFLAGHPLRSVACMGDTEPAVFDVGPGSLDNVLPLDIDEYLASLYPSGLSHDNKLKVEIPSRSEPFSDGTFVVDYRFHVRISMSLLPKEQYCSSFRVFYNVNYFGKYRYIEPNVRSFCFEVGRYEFGQTSLPEISTSLQFYGPEGGLFATAVVEGPGGSATVISSNVVRFRDTCGYGPLLNYVHT